MTRFDDDRGHETPHNPLARNRGSDESTKVSVKDLMSQIDDLKDISDADSGMGDEEDPRLKQLLEPAVAKYRKASAVLDKAMLMLKSVESLKKTAQSEIDKRVSEQVDKVCWYRKSAFRDGRNSGIKETENKFRDLVNELYGKYRALWWVLVIVVPSLTFFLTKAAIDVIGRLV